MNHFCLKLPTPIFNSSGLKGEIFYWKNRNNSVRCMKEPSLCVGMQRLTPSSS